MTLQQGPRLKAVKAAYAAGRKLGEMVTPEQSANMKQVMLGKVYEDRDAREKGRRGIVVDVFFNPTRKGRLKPATWYAVLENPWQTRRNTVSLHNLRTRWKEAA